MDSGSSRSSSSSGGDGGGSSKMTLSYKWPIETKLFKFYVVKNSRHTFGQSQYSWMLLHSMLIQ